MSEENRSCPTCGGTLPPDAPEGTCPKCLLAAGFESADGGGAPAASPGVDEVAAEFRELEILEELGRGGMGVVYEARDPAMPERRLALKLILAHGAGPDELARFQREGEALARVGLELFPLMHQFVLAIYCRRQHRPAQDHVVFHGMPNILTIELNHVRGGYGLGAGGIDLSTNGSRFAKAVTSGEHAHNRFRAAGRHSVKLDPAVQHDEHAVRPFTLQVN